MLPHEPVVRLVRKPEDGQRIVKVEAEAPTTRPSHRACVEAASVDAEQERLTYLESDIGLGREAGARYVLNGDLGIAEDRKYIGAEQYLAAWIHPSFCRVLNL
jgi:hypothetical protein